MTILIRELDPQSPLPLYRQLAQQIRRLVRLRALRAGDRIPGVRDLAVQARVNRNTAARAIQSLEAEGLVRTRVGQGTFVADGAEQRSAARPMAQLDEAIDQLLAEAREQGLDAAELRERIARRTGSQLAANESLADRNEEADR